MARRAFHSLPDSLTEYYFRGDSACYDKHELVEKPEAEDDKQFGPWRFVAIRIRKRQGSGSPTAPKPSTSPWSATYGNGKSNACWSGIARSWNYQGHP